ncbi:hypothetical protein [Francisella tularensis]|uniref:hypothetical protein n=1 Tax=Francisella tularensis TaxID=263 RepID=UPI00174BB4DF|nr:hypothetical protein [Francisella tularensis]MBD5784250.1 hypothetical protein [Francisella tularensis subsp. holarctica]
MSEVINPFAQDLRLTRKYFGTALMIAGAWFVTAYSPAINNFPGACVMISINGAP